MKVHFFLLLFILLLPACGAELETLEPTVPATSVVALSQVEVVTIAAQPLIIMTDTPAPAVLVLPSADEQVAIETDNTAYPIPTQGLETDVTSAETAYPLPEQPTASVQNDSYPVTQAEPVEIATEPAPPTATTIPAESTPYPIPAETAAVVVTETPAPTATAMPVQLNETLAGLVFKDAAGLWIVEPDGTLRLLLAAADTVDWAAAHVMVSTSGDAIAMISEGDLWQYVADSAEFRHMTNTPTSQECCFLQSVGVGQWLYGTQRAGSDNPTIGTLSFHQLDGERTTFLSEADSFGVPAVEAGMVAFDEQGVAQIAQLSNGMRTADALESLGEVTSASWQTGGDKVAWQTQLADGLAGIVVYDRQAQTSAFYHLYTPIAREQSQPNLLAWQPNGDWIAFEASDTDSAEFGIWLINTSTSEERFVAAGNNPHWSPTGTQLLWQTNSGITTMSLLDHEMSNSGVIGQLIGWVEYP